MKIPESLLLPQVLESYFSQMENRTPDAQVLADVIMEALPSGLFLSPNEIAPSILVRRWLALSAIRRYRATPEVKHFEAAHNWALNPTDENWAQFLKVATFASRVCEIVRGGCLPYTSKVEHRYAAFLTALDDAGLLPEPTIPVWVSHSPEQAV